jgi:DNA-binding SARP family transcriptional activator
VFVSAVTFGVLGTLSAANDQGPIDLKGRRHRAVLARLLVARGRVVPVRWLIDDLWDDVPAGALGSLQTFVGSLRKALEPDRPPRTPARLLITSPPGYALRAAPEAVDAWRFEAAVARAGDLLVENQAEPARLLLDDALGTWRGPAYAEFAEQDWARVEAARLEDLRRLAVRRRAEAGLASGRAAEALPDLQLQVAAEPLGEDGWRLLALALYLTGRQGDALAALRRARELLRTELGVDPGPRLRQLEADILAQAPHLHAGLNRPSTPQPRTVPAEPPRGHPPAEPPFVGRIAELGDLEAAAVATAAAGRPRLALVSGAAGAGKTALARRLAERLAATGWITAWGTSPELSGTPSAWPWTQIRASLGAADPAPGPATGGTDPSSSESDPRTARFHRHRAIGSALASLAAAHPVLLVFDDLHWADEETLALLTTLATDPDGGPVLIVGTYRSTEISAELAETLARAARAEPTRVYLGGLTEPQVRELVQGLTDRALSAAEAHTIHARSAGNPFFVRELTQLWDADPGTVEHAVPAGVRDVIRHRLARLPESARVPLHQAAVLGRQVDLDLLIQLVGDEHVVLDSVESALQAGFLVEVASERGADRLAFTHALVHETLYHDIVGARRSRWHAAAAEIIERTSPDDVAAIAHHLLRAGNRATAARAAHYAAAAAERAEHRFAPHEAARLWREAVAALDRSEPVDPQRRLTATMGMVRALAVTGGLSEARRHREQAIGAAEALGDPVLTAGVIGSFDVPAIWTANDDPALSQQLVAAAERTLIALPADRRPERARLLATIAMELRADAGRRATEAAREAEAIARGLDDPTLLAFALNGRFMQSFERAGQARERARIGTELLDLAGRHAGLVTFEVLGHLILLQAHCALADLGAADRHAAAADRLAERHGLPLVGVFTDWYAALRLALTGPPAPARTAYRAAAARLAGTGMSGLENGIFPLALLCLGATAGPDGEPPEPGLLQSIPSDADWGSYEPWARPLILLERGEHDQAVHAAADIPPSPHDLLFEARTGLHAMIAIRTGDLPAMEHLYARLLPAAGELAGAGSGLLTLGPTAFHLARLCTALGRPEQAAEHYRQGREIADRVRASALRSPPDRAEVR